MWQAFDKAKSVVSSKLPLRPVSTMSVEKSILLFLLLIFPRIKLKQALSKARKSIKQKKIFSTIVVETGLYR